MRLLVGVLMIIEVWVNGVSVSQAKEIFACLDEAAAGLHYSGGKWRPTGFETKKFILTIDGDHYATQGTDVNVPLSLTHCESIRIGGFLQCVDGTGGSLLFSLIELRGSRADLLGGILTTEKRDSLGVFAFNCQKF